MFSVTASKVVAVPPEAAWEVLCDTSRYAEYVIGTDEVSRHEGRAREGGTYDEVNTILGPWKARTHWTILELEERRTRHRSPDVPLLRHLDVIIEVAEEGEGCRVTFTLEGEPVRGPVGAAFGRLMRPMVARDNRRSVENFGEIVTRETPRRVPETTKPG